MLVGETPYTGLSAQAIISKRLIDPIPSARRLRETLPPGVDAALQRALAKTPADRFSSMDGFKQALVAPPLPDASASALSPRDKSRQAARVRRGSLLAVSALLLGVLWMRLPHSHSMGEGNRHVLAVLPFKNLGAPSEQYFVDGLTEEIRTRVASLPSLGVISRTSTDGYQKTTKSLREIGKELGAEYVLEGAVRSQVLNGKSHIRVTPQLISVSDDRHLWANDYDADLSDVFEVQGSIATQVASALDVTLGQSDRKALTAAPTQNPEAYSYYLRGLAERGSNNETFVTAVQMFEKAVELDSTFALAYSRLSEAHRKLYDHFVDREPSRLEKARSALNTALRLAPELAEARLELGRTFLASGKTRQALEQFEYVKAHQPNSSELWRSIAQVQGLEGHGEDAASSLERAVLLDPRSAEMASIASYAYWRIRRYDDAIRHADRALAIDADDPDNYLLRANLEGELGGNPSGAAAYLSQAVSKFGVGRVASSHVGTAALITALDSATRTAFERLPASAFGGNQMQFYFWKVYLNYFSGNVRTASVYADSVRAFLEPAVRSDYARDGDVRGGLATAFAFMGRKADAVREIRASLQLAPTVSNQEQAAFVYTVVGESQAAIDQLRKLLAIPSLVSVASLRTSPQWKTLRADPRLQQLLVRK